jgi:hypothetical protein
MKALKHLTLAALAVAGLLLPLAATRPQPASADFCSTLATIFTLGQQDNCGVAFGDDPTLSCSVRNVAMSATADGNQNNYAYDLICNQNTPAIHVTGNFRFDAKAADESLKTDSVSISVNWACPHDPWSAPSALICSRGTVTTSTAGDGSSIPNIDVSERTQLFSTQYLDDDARQILFRAQLQYAAAHPAPAPAPVQVILDPNIKPNDCAICNVLGSPPASAPAPTLPDLKVPTIGGDTNLAQGISSVYSVGVSNLGTKPQTQVQVSIQVTGALQYVSMTQIPSGWDCSGAGPITCIGPLGGSGDPVQNLVVSFGIQVRGTKAGIGAISAAADPNDLIHESDETNNAKALAVMVK